MKIKEKCPGEEVCTTDRQKGPCARLDRTLEAYCKPDQCKLYYTKVGVTPPEFKGLLEAVFVWRARQKSGCTRLPMPYWAEKAYLLGDSIMAQVEIEVSDPENEDEGEYMGIRGDSEAFKLIREHLSERKR